MDNFVFKSSNRARQNFDIRRLSQSNTISTVGHAEQNKTYAVFFIKVLSVKGSRWIILLYRSTNTMLAFVLCLVRESPKPYSKHTEFQLSFGTAMIEMGPDLRSMLDLFEDLANFYMLRNPLVHVSPETFS